ncbi:MAG: hypothetical protein HKO14_12635, partial [Silicimonas sp.]|nr:hypothetical protein [Silicimonas sp.]
LVILQHGRLLALYALTPVFLGMGLLTYYTLTTGIFVPVRATVFFWLLSCFLMIFGISLVAGTLARKVVLVGLVVVLVVFFSREFVLRFSYLQMWQVSSRELSERLPQDSDRIVIFGPIDTLKGAREAAIQTYDGLAYRFRFLTGKPTVSCFQSDADCSNETPPFDPQPRYDSMLIETVDRVTYIRLPALDLAP